MINQTPPFPTITLVHLWPLSTCWSAFLKLLWFCWSIGEGWVGLRKWSNAGGRSPLMTFSFIAEPPVPDSYLFLPKLSLVEGVAYLRRWRWQKKYFLWEAVWPLCLPTNNQGFTKIRRKQNSPVFRVLYPQLISRSRGWGTFSWSPNSTYLHLDFYLSTYKEKKT